MEAHWNQTRIDAYLDGELPAVEQEALRAHCDRCGTCRALLEDRRSLLNAIRSGRPRVEAPASLRDKVNALLESESHAPNADGASDAKR